MQTVEGADDPKYNKKDNNTNHSCILTITNVQKDHQNILPNN